MLTARSSLYRGGTLSGGLPDRDPHDRDLTPDRDHPDRDPLEGTWDQRQRHATSKPDKKRHHTETPSPTVDRMTDKCKNITLPQTFLRVVIKGM